MRLSDAFSRLEPDKRVFASALVEALGALPGLRSITFTGSFVEQTGLEGISDIDVVVVVSSLSASLFQACQDAVAALPPALLGLPGHRLLVNASFGPLKFDAAGLIVVHLMVYDLAGHRDHVLKSPFTCLDWERSPFHAGPSLRALYPTPALQPRDFLEARRSLSNYLNDLASGSLSFRRLVFEQDQAVERLERHPLDPRHQGEYAYHILRNLLSNYAKLLSGQNQALPERDYEGFVARHLPSCLPFLAWLRGIAAIKRSRGLHFPDDTIERTRDFLAAFSEDLRRSWSEGVLRHVCVRHGRTALNDGSFLGQGRDPGLLEAPPALPTPGFVRVVSSPLLRCRETAAGLAPGLPCACDPRLAEQDYGLAEGLKPAELFRRFPEMAAAWARGEDPAFPGGESTTAVLARLEECLKDADQGPAALLVTHNGVLRCLLGSALGLPLASWFRIPVAHLEMISVLRRGARSYLELSLEQRARILDAVSPETSQALGLLKT